MDVNVIIGTLIGSVIAVGGPITLFLVRNQKNFERLIDQLKLPAIEAKVTAQATQSTAQDTLTTVNQFSSQMTSVLTYLADANRELAAQKAAVLTENQAYHKRVEDNEDKIKKFTSEVDSLLKQRALDSQARDAQIAELVEKVGSMDDALRGTQKALTEAQVELETTKSELLEKLRLTQIELELAKARIVELERQYATAVTEKAQVEKDLATANEKVVQLETQVRQLQGQVRDLQNQLDAQKPTAPPETTTMP